MQPSLKKHLASTYTLVDSPRRTLEQTLAQDSVNVAGFTQRWLREGQGRVDVTHAPLGALSYALASAVGQDQKPCLICTPDEASARHLAADLRFMLGASDASVDQSPVVLLPAPDTTPFVQVAPDRRVTMDRLSALARITRDTTWRFWVSSVTGLMRLLPPPSAIAARSYLVEAEGELDRDAFLLALVSGGYLRTPVAEDPGTFAVRGSIIDVYPPQSSYPVRIELDDWLVLSVKQFNPDTQRTLDSVAQVTFNPVRETLVPQADDAGELRTRLHQLCDSVNYPTLRAKQLIDDVMSGRHIVGIEAYLPAFYGGLCDAFSYLPAGCRRVLIDPVGCQRAYAARYAQAQRDAEARKQDGSPCYGLEDHYLDAQGLITSLSSPSLCVVHPLAVLGQDADDEAESDIAAAFAPLLSPPDADALLRLGGEDHQPLRQALRQRRSNTSEQRGLYPLASRIEGWINDGMRVVLTTRTSVQGERLAQVLKTYGVQVKVHRERVDVLHAHQLASECAHVVMGSLHDGFVLGTELLVCVTEEEIFGERRHRRHRPKKLRDQAQAFLEDLRELQTGDYVVHTEHGIGRYLGIERKHLGQSQSDKMLGKPVADVEVLVIEYRSGKLFLPVTRLHQIQKYASKEGLNPRLDKLGGQSFAKTKAKVRRDVRHLADALLKLYAQRAADVREGLAPSQEGDSYAEFEATFPFEETPDQARAIDEVMADLESPRAMDRLICGDVGFGKTEVAMRAAFRVAMAGRQVALLCPTTVLAQQHYLTFQERFRDYPLRLAMMSRFLDRKEQTEIVTGLKEGKVDVVVGTHRLLSKDIHFHRLGLLVVDEEQRFGVTHKERIKQLRAHVDVLTLSATPIPRTLQMAVSGLRDLSLITTAPVDRRAIRTFVSRWDDHLLREAIQRELNRGGQVFFVYNRIEGLYERAARLQELMPDVRIAVAHGQMKEGALEQLMTEFVEGQYDMLCSTTIIESGLDIPRANTMIIDRADTFGLSQLYQLRGRVGRSRERAYCYLLTPPVNRLTDEARYRIEALERFTTLGSGFQIASLDMELRGAGNVLGAEQSGSVSAVGTDLFVHMLEEAVAELRGETYDQGVDPELTFDMEHYIADDYIDDVGLRLSFYKKLASAADESTVFELGSEMEDRFGPMPEPVRHLIRIMALKPALRKLRVLGCEANATRVTLHVDQQTPLEPEQIMRLVAKSQGAWRLTPDFRLHCRFEQELEVDAVTRVQEVLSALGVNNLKSTIQAA